MVILSEVVAPIKRESQRRNGKRAGLFLLLSFLPLAVQGATGASGTDAPISLDQLNDCNWMVTYRGRTYDLAPLTREALSRPIESDIRFALQRVPAASAHLNQMSTHLHDARAHTILASIFVSGFVLTRVLRSNAKDPNDRENFDVASVATGLFFLASTAFSWKSTHDAKNDLIHAVEAFNEESPHKIVPASESQEIRRVVP